MEEKPEHPRSDLVSTATYLFSAEHLGLLERYLAEGNRPDPPGALPDVARRARARLRVPLLRVVARHRRSRAAPRRGQPVPGRERASRARVVRPVENSSHNRQGHVTLFALPLTAWLFEVLVPSRCVSCGGPGPLFCESCLYRLVPLHAPVCARCGAPTAWPVERCRECAGRRIAFASARAGFVYADPARAFVRGWKERGARPLAAVAAELVAGRVPRPAADVIAYIPPDNDRSLRRGHQPAEALARELGRRWDVPVAPLLARRRRVARQTGLARDERRRNMRDAFVGASARAAAAWSSSTTSTRRVRPSSSAATALRAAGASRVDVVTFARAIR